MSQNRSFATCQPSSHRRAHHARDVLDLGEELDVAVDRPRDARQPLGDGRVHGDDDVRGPDRTRDAGDERHQPGDGRGEDREAATGRGAGHQDHGTFPGRSFRASSACFRGHRTQRVSRVNGTPGFRLLPRLFRPPTLTSLRRRHLACFFLSSPKRAARCEQTATGGFARRGAARGEGRRALESGAGRADLGDHLGDVQGSAIIV